MPQEAQISVNERAFIQDALKEQIRLDGRAFDAFRALHLTFGDEYGVADVQLGKTRYDFLVRSNSRVLIIAESLPASPSTW